MHANIKQENLILKLIYEELKLFLILTSSLYPPSTRVLGGDAWMDGKKKKNTTLIHYFEIYFLGVVKRGMFP